MRFSSKKTDQIKLYTHMCISAFSW